MFDLFSDDARRNPYPIYAELRTSSPVLCEPQSGLWMVFDYGGVQRALSDHEAFSSRFGPVEWLNFFDPPRHTQLRSLISQAFTTRSIASLEPRIESIARELFAKAIEHGELDLAEDFSVPLPLMVIAEMLGVPAGDWLLFRRWNDVILKMSYTISGAGDAAGAFDEFAKVTAEMRDYLAERTGRRRTAPQDDLLTRLATADVDGERLAQDEILGFFQLLLLAGSETTTNLINNMLICLLENPEQLLLLRGNLELLPSAIEEVLRYRSPLQWMYRITRCDVEMHGRVIPSGQLVLAMIGSANHDSLQFPEPDRFDIRREPNSHIAFGHGIHFCPGAPLSRLEARLAIAVVLAHAENIEFASDEPWTPRKALHVHGPASLPLRIMPRQ